MEDFIKCYFGIGLNNKEILCVLAQNHSRPIVISIRTLKGRCRRDSLCAGGTKGKWSDARVDLSGIGVGLISPPEKTKFATTMP